MNRINKHLIISGRVQGVGFRYFTYRNAKELRLKGWVKNLRDGTVETVFTGDAENVYEMVDKLKEGPASARVENIKNVDSSVDAESFNDFTIKR